MNVFLSYHSPDRERAKQLKQLIEENITGTTVFFDQTHLRHGFNWQPQLYEAIDRSSAFVIIINNKLGNWQTAEYFAAHDKKINNPDTFALLPLIVADRQAGPVPNLPGLSQLHWIDAGPSSAHSAADILISALRGAPQTVAPRPWQLVNPYRGLLALEENDADFFYGREDETEGALSVLARNPGKIIALIGNSGVGKSSLAQAGVISSLKRQIRPSGQTWLSELSNSRRWTYLSIRPSDNPVRSLATAFVRLWFDDDLDPEKYRRIRLWEDRLREVCDIAEILDATRTHFSSRGDAPPQTLFVYIDQAEELYSRSDTNERDIFSRLIASIARRDDARVMLSQRSDYYGNFQNNHHLFDFAVRLDVPPLRPDHLQRVLTGPAEKLSAKFEPRELPARIAQSAQDQPGALALISDLMIELWDRMQQRGDGVIRPFDDASIIDIGKPLWERADRFVKDNSEMRETIRRLFTLKLIKIYEDGAPFRKRVHAPDCDLAEWRAVELLANPEWRLLVTGTEEGVPFAEVAHDILLAHWNLLRDWVREQRQFLLWVTNTERDFIYWLSFISGSPDQASRSEKDAAFNQPEIHRGDKALLRGARLDEAETYLAVRRLDIENHLQKFVERSIALVRNSGSDTATGATHTSKAIKSLPKLNIFYARRDIASVEQLRPLLDARGIETLLDFAEIAVGEEWQKRLIDLIRQSDAVLFVISEASVQSQICAWEIEQALKFGKKIIPILIESVSPASVPERVSAINWIRLLDDDGKPQLVKAADEIATAVHTDFDWIREHSRLSEMVNAWLQHNRPSSLLLRGSALSSAEAWMQIRPRRAPEITAEQLEFLSQSRSMASRRQRSWVGGMVAVTLSSLLLAGFAYVQANEAAMQKALADESRVMAEQASSQAASLERIAGSLKTELCSISENAAREPEVSVAIVTKLNAQRAELCRK